MKIAEIKNTDYLREVVYIGEYGTPKIKGVITAWNEKYVFVDFEGKGKGNNIQTCLPETLHFNCVSILS